LQLIRAAGIVLAGLAFAAAVGGLSPRAGGAGLIISVVGLICVCNAVRIWWLLFRHPWQAWECRFREVPGYANGSPTLVLSQPGDREEFVLGVVSFRWRWRVLNACDRGTVWMAGNPARGGVVAPPGGTHLLWVRHPIFSKRRQSLRRATLQGAQLDQPG
jgi:hypothetical protein